MYRKGQRIIYNDGSYTVNMLITDIDSDYFSNAEETIGFKLRGSDNHVDYGWFDIYFMRTYIKPIYKKSPLPGWF